MISAELRGGQAALVLAKPLSRGAYVTSKWLAQVLSLVAAVVPATVLCVVVTAALLGAGPADRLPAAVGLWLLYAVLLMSAGVAFSAWLRAPAAASAAAFGVYAALLVLAQFPALRDASPAGLMHAAQQTLLGSPSRVGWPVAGACVGTALLLVCAVAGVRRREV